MAGGGGSWSDSCKLGAVAGLSYAAGGVTITSGGGGSRGAGVSVTGWRSLDKASQYPYNKLGLSEPKGEDGDVLPGSAEVDHAFMTPTLPCS